MRSPGTAPTWRGGVMDGGFLMTSPLMNQQRDVGGLREGKVARKQTWSTKTQPTAPRRSAGNKMEDMPVHEGITFLFFTAHGGPVGARALFLRNDGDDASMCDGVRPCRQNVFDQIQCQVAQLNMSAQKLFKTYLERQGPPFTENPDVFCAADRSFPPFVDEASEKKEMLLSLYKIFAFFNASLGNITKDQENLGDDKDEKAALMKHLRNATKVARGLLANLTCLLCSEYKVRHVDVVYGDNSGTDIFQKKKRGCQVLRSYAKVIAHAAAALGHCRKKQT
ncbi:leukemia inhibitory factor isoform X2 [Sceloporus undulatus]|nr:leukemia inhibitory factor isoform X2 [Sceloporus undulatus]